MIHYRISTTTPLHIHDLITAAMASTSTSASSSNSFSSSAREKYSPPPTPSPLQHVRNPFMAPDRPRLNIPDSRPRRSRAKTLGRLAILLIVLIVLFSGVNSWVCTGDRCPSRKDIIDSARKIGHDSGAYVGGGAVLGKLGWAQDGQAQDIVQADGALSQEEREGLMMNDVVGQADDDNSNSNEEGDKWFVPSEEGAEHGEPVFGEKQRDDSAQDVEGATDDQQGGVDMLAIDDVDTNLAKEIQLIQESIDDAAPDTNSDVVVPEQEPEPEHTHVGETDVAGLTQAVQEGHTLGSMDMDMNF